MWSSFYILRIKDRLPFLWRELTLKLDVIIDDPLLEQSIYQEVFEGLVQEYFSSHCNASVPSTTHVATEITDDELKCYALMFLDMLVILCYSNMKRNQILLMLLA